MNPQRNFKYHNHSITLLQAVAAGAGGNSQFDLNNDGKTFKIKSIFYDVRIYETVSLKPFPLEMNNTQECYLNITQIIARDMSQHFINIVGLPVQVHNADAFRIYKTGQYFFDSFFCLDRLRFILAYTNNAPALQYSYEAQVITEIEDIEVTA